MPDTLLHCMRRDDSPPVGVIEDHLDAINGQPEPQLSGIPWMMEETTKDGDPERTFYCSACGETITRPWEE